MSPADVLNLIKEKGVKFVDLRLTDTRGKEQHVSVTVEHQIDDGFFEDGKMFDGSSIAGWKGINESDMILMPDCDTAVMDVFSEEPTLNITCDVVEPSTMQGYERDPRSLPPSVRYRVSEVDGHCPQRPFLAPRTSSSSSTIFVGARRCTTPSTRSARPRAPGILRLRATKAITGTGRRSRVVISRSRRSTRCTTCVRQCAWHSKRWASLPRCTTMRLRPQARMRSASSSVNSSARPMKSSC